MTEHSQNNLFPVLPLRDIVVFPHMIVPLFVGAAPLTSFFFEADLPVLGHVEFVTSTLFDIGVYLVVIGLVLDVLRSLGAEVDRQALEAGEGHRPEVTVS